MSISLAKLSHSNGFHNFLEIDLQYLNINHALDAFYIPRSVEEIMVIITFNKSSYIEIHELNRLFENISFEVFSNEDINIDLPAFKSSKFRLVMLVASNKASFSIPFHVRYQAAGNCVYEDSIGEYKKIELITGIKFYFSDKMLNFTKEILVPEILQDIPTYQVPIGCVNNLERILAIDMLFLLVSLLMILKSLIQFGR